MAERVAAENLVWSVCSHDHGCATRDGFEKKAGWMRPVLERARRLGIRFLTAEQYYREADARRRASAVTSGRA